MVPLENSLFFSYATWHSIYLAFACSSCLLQVPLALLLSPNIHNIMLSIQTVELILNHFFIKKRLIKLIIQIYFKFK